MEKGKLLGFRAQWERNRIIICIMIFKVITEKSCYNKSPKIKVENRAKSIDTIRFCFFIFPNNMKCRYT